MVHCAEHEFILKASNGATTIGVGRCRCAVSPDGHGASGKGFRISTNRNRIRNASVLYWKSRLRIVADGHRPGAACARLVADCGCPAPGCKRIGANGRRASISRLGPASDCCRKTITCAWVVYLWIRNRVAADRDRPRATGKRTLSVVIHVATNCYAPIIEGGTARTDRRIGTDSDRLGRTAICVCANRDCVGCRYIVAGVVADRDIAAAEHIIAGIVAGSAVVVARDAVSGIIAEGAVIVSGDIRARRIADGSIAVALNVLPGAKTEGGISCPA
ncbi:MAG: hypothetical protein WBP94_05925 [Rhodomicrobiaceae bacterium]